MINCDFTLAEIKNTRFEITQNPEDEDSEKEVIDAKTIETIKKAKNWQEAIYSDYLKSKLGLFRNLV